MSATPLPPPLPREGRTSARFSLELAGERPLVMGILNVTPDSFSDGGLYLDREIAIEAALRMEQDGAAIVDVGGESTRPGSDPTPLDEELERVVPVVEAIRRRSGVAISVDTRKAAVAKAAIAAGADIVNDVSAFAFDPAMAEAVREAGVPVILMHMRGTPKTMQEGIHFDDLMGEIHAELAERRSAAVAAGIDGSLVWVDPGVGFGKTFQQNLEILARAAELGDLGPLVIGASRKGFIGQITGRPGGRPRMAGSLAAVAAAQRAGAAVVRVHDVAETVDFLKVSRAVAGGRP